MKSFEVILLVVENNVGILFFMTISGGAEVLFNNTKKQTITLDTSKTCI